MGIRRQSPVMAAASGSMRGLLPLHALATAAEAMRTGRWILELIRDKKILIERQIAELLDPAAMTRQAREPGA